MSDNKLEKEVLELREEVAKLRKELGTKTNYRTCLIVLCALFAVFVILPVLLAVALPMYSTFKGRSKVSMALKSAMGTQASLQEWYGGQGNFENLSVSGEGGPITAGDMPTGAALDSIENLSWNLLPVQGCIKIQFEWRAGCPPENCDGFFELCCEGDVCTTAVQVGGEDDPLGLNFGPDL